MEPPHLPWEPAIDAPATVVVIGGGPVGIEAALYARFLGYSVLVLEQAKVGDSLLPWGDAPMGEDWNEVTTSLGLAALEAQQTLALPDARPTCRSFVEHYLLPVARTDLLHDGIHVHSRVVSVSRLGCPPNHELPVEIRAEREFRVMFDSRQRGHTTQIADIILDCSGMASRRCGLSSGGGLAANELDFVDRFLHGKIDVPGAARASCLGKHCLLWGNTYEAVCNAKELLSLAEEDDATRITWVIPKQLGQSSCRPAWPANTNGMQFETLLKDPPNALTQIDAWGIEAIQPQADGWKLRLQTTEEETLDVSCDVFVNCASPLPDWRFAQPLAAQSLLNEAHAPDSPSYCHEPHYYVLGQKSWGTETHCMKTAQAQIRQLFSRIGDRRELDLYSTVKPQN